MKRVEALFEGRLEVVNIGLECFHTAMQMQQVPCVQVEWKPPAGGDARVLEILEKLNS